MCPAAILDDQLGWGGCEYYFVLPQWSDWHEEVHKQQCQIQQVTFKKQNAWSAFVATDVNPACENVTCENGGSCIYINDTHNTVCSCRKGYSGQFCQGKVNIQF